jgi:hypothetical protein
MGARHYIIEEKVLGCIWLNKYPLSPLFTLEEAEKKAKQLAEDREEIKKRKKKFTKRYY